MIKLDFKTLCCIWVPEVGTKGNSIREDFYLLRLSKDLLNEALRGTALKEENSVIHTELPIAYLHRYMQTYSRSRRWLVQNLLSARDTAAEPAYWPHWWMYTNSEKQIKKSRKNLCLCHCTTWVFSLWLLACNSPKTRTRFSLRIKKYYMLFQYLPTQAFQLLTKEPRSKKLKLPGKRDQFLRYCWERNSKSTTATTVGKCLREANTVRIKQRKKPLNLLHKTVYTS